MTEQQQIDMGYKFAQMEDAQFLRATEEVAKIIDSRTGNDAKRMFDYWVVVTMSRQTWRKSQGLA
jgi:hypothetical protein